MWKLQDFYVTQILGEINFEDSRSAKSAILTDRIRTPQTKTQMAKSPILVKLGWVDQLMGGVHHAQYFCPGTTLVGVAAHPNSGFTSKC